MATSWMKAKEAKIKRDGLARSRGISPTFSKTERDHFDPARLDTKSGWYVVAKDRTPRGLPRSYGPFPGHDTAKTFGDGLVTPARKGAKPLADDYILQDRTVARVTSQGRLTPEMIAAAPIEHAAKLAAQRELSRATREALGHRTAWAR